MWIESLGSSVLGFIGCFLPVELSDSVELSDLAPDGSQKTPEPG